MQEEKAKTVIYAREAICRGMKDSKLYAFELTASKVSNGVLLSPKRTVFHCESAEELQAWVFHLNYAVKEEQPFHQETTVAASPPTHQPTPSQGMHA
jgi:hypothetical protein